MSTNEGRVYFALDGDDFDPDDITLMLGIKPSYIKRKGERVPGRLPKKNSWVLSTDNIVADYIDIFNLSTDIVNQLKSKKDLIIQAKNKFNVSPRFEVVLSITTNEEISTPAIGFEADTIQFLGEIGAFIDIDTYRNQC